MALTNQKILGASAASPTPKPAPMPTTAPAPTQKTTPESVVGTPAKPMKQATKSSPNTKGPKFTQEEYDAVREENFAQDQLGTFSDKWEFLGTITDESKKDKNNVRKGVNDDTRIDTVTGTPIGYLLRALEDGLEYYVQEIDAYYRDNPFSFRGQLHKKVASKGEEVQFTMVEITDLLVRGEYNAVLTGGDYSVQLVLRTPRKSANAIEVDKDLAPYAANLAPLRGSDTPSLKVLPTFPAITGESRPNPDNAKVPIVDRKIVPGFERFAPAIGEKKKRRPKAAATTTAAEGYNTVRNPKAAAMFKYLASRKAD